MAVLCPGYEAKNPAESLVRELVTLDLATARETGRLALEPGTFIAGQSRDRRTLVLLQGLSHTDKFPYPKSKVTLVDVTGPSVSATLDTGTWSLIEGDGLARGAEPIVDDDDWPTEMAVIAFAPTAAPSAP